MSCSSQGIAPPRKVVSVNGRVIARDMISREAQHHPSDKPISSWGEAATALVIRELLLREAERLSIEAEPRLDEHGRRETDEEARMRALIEQAAPTPIPDDAACRRYFEQNRRRFRTSDLFEVNHILLAADPSDRRQVDEARTRAAAITSILATEPDKFGDLARQHSDCPSAAQGGNLGQIGKGQTVPEFEAALTTMEVGKVADKPLQSRYGLHIVRVERRIDGRDLPFEAVAKKIAAYLAEAVERRALSQYVTVLAGRADIVGVELAASSSPLLQ